MGRELLELAGEQAGKARLEPLRSFDDKKIMDHLHKAHAGPRLQPDQDRDVFLLPPKISRIEQDVAVTRQRSPLQRRQPSRPAAGEEPFDQPIEAQKPEDDVRDMVITGIGQQQAKRRQAHAAGKEGPQASDGGRSARRHVEVGQEPGIDPVEGVMTQHAGHEFNLVFLPEGQCGNEFLGDPLDAGRMPEVGIPMNDAGDVEQYPAAAISLCLLCRAADRGVVVQ